MRCFAVFLTVLLSVTNIHAGPTGSRTCAKECKVGSKFLYEIGKKYEYDYEVKGLTYSESLDPENNLKLTGVVGIQAVTPCEYSLTLRDVHLHGSEKSEEFAYAVTQNSLRFSFQNGEIEHVCATPEDANWVVNFKKGILSQFQTKIQGINHDKTTTEKDVNGICETDYKIIETHDGFEIQKEKNINTCKKNAEMTANMMSVGFDGEFVGKEFHVAGGYSCHQSISKGTFSEISCDQKFSHQSQKLTLHTKLTFRGSFVNAISHFERFSERSCLLFDHTKTEDDNNIKEILYKLAQSSNVEKDTPRYFSELVAALRTFNVWKMQSLSRELKTSPAYKYFKDALLLVHTPDAMKLVADLIEEREYTYTEKDIWLTSLSFIKNPTVEMFPAFHSLVKIKDHQTMLTVSSLLNTYCQTHENCELHVDTMKIILSFEESLGRSCRISSNDQKMNMLIDLKSLGNVGEFMNAHRNSMKGCYTDKENPMEIRLAAIEAYRRAPCKYDRQDLLSTYQDTNQDTEIRIAAYLAAMKCPSEEMVDIVKDRLTSEGVNDVTSYVWSHLSNIQESADPHKAHLKELIGDEMLQKKFTSESLKLSQYYESSFYLKEQELGGNVEADVIFSPESVFPKSTRFNLTVDVFGKPVNLFEIGTHMEGMEYFVEKFFGPNGYYPEETIANIIRNMRSKRFISNSHENKEPHGSMFMRFLGNELYYKHFTSSQDILKEFGISNPMEMMLNFLNKGSIDFNKNVNILDINNSFSSIAGLPINFHLISSASISINFGGKIDFNKMHFDGKLKASAAATSDINLIIDCTVSKFGSTHKKTAHSSTSLGGRLNINGGAFSFEIDAPEEKQEILNTNLEIFNIKDSKEIQITFATNDDFITNEYPVPGFGTFGVRKNKVSSEIYYEKSGTYKSHLIRGSLDLYGFNFKEGYIMYDKIGSFENSKWKLTWRHRDSDFTYSLITPGSYMGMTLPKELTAQGKINFEDWATSKAEGFLQYTLSEDYSKKYGFLFKRKNDANGEDFNFKIYDSDNDIVKIEFKEDIAKKEYTTYFGSKVIFPTEITWKLNLREDKPSTYLKMTWMFFHFEGEGSLKSMVISPTKIEFDIDGSYSLDERTTSSLSSSFKFENMQEGTDNAYKIHISSDIADFEANYELKTTNDGGSDTFSLKYEEYEFTGSSHFFYNVLAKNKYLDVKFSAQCPQLNYKVYFEKKVELSDTQLKSNGEFSYNSQLSVKSDINMELWKSIGISLKMNSGFMRVFSIDLVAKQETDGKWITKLDYNGNKLLDATYHDKSVPGETCDYNLQVESNIGILSQNPHAFKKEFSLSIFADASSLQFKTSGKYGENEVFFVCKASPTEISFSSNTYKPLSAMAKIVPYEDGHSLKMNMNVDSEEIVSGSAMYTSNSIEASVSYDTKRFAFSGNLLEKGFESSMEWSPEKRVKLLTTYNNGKDKSFVTSLETPFEGYEKQELRISCNGDTASDATVQVSAIWANINHFTVTADNKFSSTDMEQDYTSTLKFTSTFENYETISLKSHVLHEKGKGVDVNVKMHWNHKNFEGKLSGSKNDGKYTGNYFLKTPYTEDINVKGVLNITPEEVSLNIHSNYQDTELTGKIVTNPNFNLEINGKRNSHKMSLHYNSITNFAETKTIKGSLQFISSFTEPFSMNFVNKWSESGGELDVDVTSIRYPGQNYKMHVTYDGYEPKSISGYISGPDINAKLKYTHVNQNILLDVIVIDYQLTVDADYSFSLVDKTGSINIKTKSNFEFLNGLNFIASHLTDDNKYTTDISLTQGEFNFKINNLFDWSNQSHFEIKTTVFNNDCYFHFKKNSYKYLLLDIKYNDEFNFKYLSDYESNYATTYTYSYNVQIHLKSTMTPFIHINFTDENHTVRLDAKFICKYLFWTPISFNLSNNNKVYDMEFKLKVHNFLNINGKLTDYFQSGQMSIEQPREGTIQTLTSILPIKFNYSYKDKRIVTSMLHVANHNVNLKASKEFNTWSVDLNTNVLSHPLSITGHFTMDLEYKLDLTLITQGRTYSLEGTFDWEKLTFNAKHPFGTEHFTCNWEILEKTGNIDIDILSSILSNIVLNINYDLNKNTVKSNAKINDKKYVFTAIYNSDKYEINFITPITNYAIDMKISKSQIEITSFKNGEKQYELIAYRSFDSSKTISEINLSTPFKNYENNKFKLEYNLQEPKSVSFTAQIGSESIVAETEIKNINEVTNQVTFSVKSSFKMIKNIVVESSFSNQQNAKEVKLHGNYNGKLFDWKFSIDQNKMKFLLNSDIQDWKIYKIEGMSSISEGDFMAFVDFNDGSSNKHYEFNLKYSYEKFEIKAKSPFPNYEVFYLNGKYTSENDFSFMLNINEKIYEVSGSIDKPGSDYNVALIIKYETQEMINLSIAFQIYNQYILDFSLNINKSHYKVYINSDLEYERGTVKSSFILPISGFTSFSVEGKYTLAENPDIYLEINLEEKKVFHASITNKEYGGYEGTLSLPFEGFENIRINGYSNSRGYSVRGVVGPEDMESTTGNAPFAISGQVNKDELELTFSNGEEDHEIHLQYGLSDTEAFIKFRSTFETLNKLDINGKYQLSDYGAISSSVNIRINQRKLNLNGEFKGTKYNSILAFGVSSPNNDEKYYFKSYYNLFTSKENVIGFVLDTPALQKSFVMSAIYHPEYPYKMDINIKSSIPDYENIGLSYEINIENENNEYNSFITVLKNAVSFTFGFETVFDDKSFMTKIVTPFEHYETLSFHGMFDKEENEGKLNIVLGDWILKGETKYKINDFKILIQTPFERLNNFDIVSKFDWTSYNKEMIVRLRYNDVLYDLSCKIPTSMYNLNFLFNFETPFDLLKVFRMSGKIEYAAPIKQLEIGFEHNELKYLFSTDASWNGMCSHNFLNWKLISPFSGYKDVEFKASLKQGYTFEVSFSREGKTHDIFISGSELEDGPAFGEENSFVTLTRSKRSLSKEMMNDFGRGGIINNFKSLRMSVKTPFNHAKSIEWSLSRADQGGFEFHYKRNEHYIDLSVESSGKKKGLDISVKSAIPGWEIMALTGRLDKEEVVGYLSGKLNEKQVKISGSGSFEERSGELNIEIITPFKDYQKVDVVFKYNVRRNEFSINAKSHSSKFKFIVKHKLGLSIDILVPHKETDTVIKGRLTIYKGSLTVSSRFSFIKSYSLSYGIQLRGEGVKIHFTIIRNDIKRFDIQFEKDPSKGLGHLMVMIKLFGNESKFHYHRDHYKSLDISYTRNDKKINLSAKGEGNLPTSGKINFTVTNGFRAIPKTVTGDITVDRTGSPKKITMNISYNPARLYTFFLTYNIDLNDIKSGDYVLKINTPDRMAAPWKSISGSWSVDENHYGFSKVSVGSLTITATGTYGLHYTDLVIEPSLPGKPQENWYVGWKFDKSDNSKDYYLKFGKESRYVMMKLKGTFTREQGHIEGAFKASKYMKHDFNYALNWETTDHSNKTRSGDGTFSYGKKNVKLDVIYFRRDASKRAAQFKMKAKTNIPKYKNVVLEGEYSLAERMVDIKFTYDTDYFAIKGKLDNMSWEHSDNTITAHIPPYGDGKMRITHDFSNPLDKKIIANGELGGKKAAYNIKWTRNKEFTVLDLDAVLKSPLVGDVNVNANYDVSNIDNAKLNLKYTRNEDKFVNIDWKRVMKKSSLDNELNFSSHFKKLPSAKVFVNANWKSGFSLEGGVDCHGKSVISAKLEVGVKKAEFSFKSPFPLIKDISATANYSFKPKARQLTVNYKRGDVEVSLDFNMKILKKKNGSLKLKFTSPFEFAKILNIDAKWEAGKLNATYKRNDIEMKIQGDADMKFGKSSVDLHFTPPGKSPVHIKFAYDYGDFKEGKGNSPKELVNLDLSFAGKNIKLTANGYRNSEKIHLEIDGTSTFNRFRKFYILVDSELNLTDRHGHLKIIIDDFEYDMKNTMKYSKHGYYFATHITSSLTPLPDLKMGIGREKDEVIVTIGAGEKEISVSFNAKDRFKKGFSGKIRLPHRNISFDYNIGYSFLSDDKLQVDMSFDIGEGKIEAEFLYHSSGVKSRLSTPWGGHVMRVKRSLDNNEMSFEGAINGNKCRINVSKLFKKGIFIEGEIFGKQFSLETKVGDYFQSGTYLIKTPFSDFRTIGLEYNLRKHSKAVLYLPKNIKVIYKSRVLRPKVSGELSIFIFEKTYSVSFKTDYKYDGAITLEANAMHPFNENPSTLSFRIQKMDYRLRNWYADLSLQNVFGDHKIVVNGNGRYNNYNIEFKNESPLLPSEFNFSYDIGSPKKHFELSTEAFSTLIHYENINGSYPNLKLESSLGNKQKIYDVSFELSYSADIVVDFKAALFDNAYKLAATASNTAWLNKISVIFNKKENVSGRINFELTNENVLMDVSCSEKQNHSIRFALNYRRGLKVDINLPLIPLVGKVEAGFGNPSTILFNGRKLVVLHEMDGFKRQILKIDLSLPTSSRPYSIYAAYDYDFEDHRAAAKIEIDDTNNVHIFSGKSAFGDYSGKIHLLLKSPYLHSKKSLFNLAYDFNTNVKVVIETFLKESHSIYLDVKREEFSIISNAVSPYIPTGMVKLEGSVSEFTSTEGVAELYVGTSNGNLATIKLNSKFNTNNNEILMEIKTPFENFENIKFGSTYVILSDITQLSIFMEPLDFELGGYFGKKDSVIEFGMNAKTNLESWRESEVEVSIPLNFFKPHFYAKIHDKEYGFDAHYDKNPSKIDLGAEVLLPTGQFDYNLIFSLKSPYEFDLKAKSDHFTRHFNIMFDSSFLILYPAIMMYI